MVDFVSEFVFENYSVATGRTVLKRRCPGRRIYSITTASRDFGVSPKRLGMLLVEKGLAQTHGNITRLKELMTEDEARTSVEEARELLTRPEASERLNVSAEIFDDLVRQNIIQRKIGGQRYVANFPACALDQILERIFASAKPYKVCSADLVDIHRAAKSQCSIATIVSRVLEGDLTRVGRLIARRGIPALLVDLDEVRGTPPVVDCIGITRTKLAGHLGVKTMTISHLIDQEILSLETDTVQQRGRAVETINQSSVERFLGEYITLACLARQLNRKPGPLSQQLAAKEIHPISMPDGLNRIFRQAALEEADIRSPP